MDNACGFCGFRPKLLQRLATPRIFMVVYGLLGTVQAMSFIYFTISLTTMERRFKIPSKTTGIMLSGNELSQIMLALFLSYFGGQRNRPRWIAWGVALCSLSCFILALPHFIYGPGEEALALTAEYADQAESNLTTIFGQKLSSKVAKLCIPNRQDEDCTSHTTLAEYSLLPIILVFISQFVLGIGNTLYYSLGNTYMDDNTKKTNTPMMLGYACAIRTMGPVFGFILGPLCLSVFIEPSLTPLVSKDDARWLGAWWLGWIILGFLMLLFAILVGLFPKHLPKKEKTSELPQYPKPIAIEPAKSMDALPLNRPQPTNLSNDDKPTMRELPIALRRLLVNKLLMGNLVSSTFYILGSSVYITYLAKYIEVQYHTPAARSTAVVGPLVLIGMVAGFLLSGWYISKKRPTPRVLLFWNVIVGFLYVCGETSFIFFGCPVAEVETQLLQSRSLLITECNQDCSCEGVKYDPVCHRLTNQLYFSACHAGCSNRLPGSQAFTNCTCLAEPIQPSTEFLGSNFSIGIDQWNMVHAGSCSQNCYFSFLMFGIVSTLVNVIGSSGRIGNILVNYRCVEERDKSFAQGLMLLVLSLFALIPGPIIFGFIIDSTCVEWAGSCATTTNCVLYDRDMFRHYVNVAAVFFTSIGLLFDVFVWYYGKDLDLYGDRSDAAKIPRRERDSSYN